MSEIKKVSNEIIDNLGRTIKLKNINGKIRIAFYRALGSRDCDNKMILMEYWPVMAVDSIDGEPMGSIKSLIDIEATYAKIETGNAIDLINEWLLEKGEEAQSNNQEVNKEIKK